MDAERTTQQAAPVRSARQRFVGGLRLGLVLSVPTFVMAITFGALARSAGWGVAAPIVCSVLVFSGSAQFALLTALGGGSGALTAVAAAASINARFIPMGVAVGTSLRGGRLRKATEGQAVVDASWAAAHRGGGQFDREQLIGATLAQWPAWVIGTIVGVLAAPPEALIETLGLDVIFPAFFLLLLLDEVRRSQGARVAAVLAAVAAGGLLLAVPAGLVLVATTAVALIGLLPRFREVTS
jgi:4-azaleucine resistance transporter AzlC